MTKIKRALAGALSLVMATSVLASCGDNSSSTGSTSIKEGNDESKNTLVIYCWNDEFKQRFEKYYPDYAGNDTLKDGTKIEWVQVANEGNAYQTKLDEALKNQADADKKVDMFLIEADYATKYVNSDVSLDVKSIGITDEDLANQYTYTHEITTDSSGALKALSWQATPGLYVYRRSLAKEVLGTDDPTKVQEMLSDWTKFDEVAAKMKDAGYYMLSGFDDSYRVFSNNVSAPWVNSDNQIVIDDSIKAWVDQTKTYTDKGYNAKTSLWSKAWAAGQGPSDKTWDTSDIDKQLKDGDITQAEYDQILADMKGSAGKVFGYFYSTWGIAFTLLGNSEITSGAKDGLYGDWAVCLGPESFYWGGTWIVCANGSDNQSQVADIMKKLTCDTDIMQKITEEQSDYTNNKQAIKNIVDGGYTFDFLGGQNHIALLAEAAEKIDASKISAYDQGLNEKFQAAMKDYFIGNTDYDTALANFYENAIALYPTLKK